MGFVDKSDRMVSSYGIAQRTWKSREKNIFPPSRHDYSQCLVTAQVMWWKNDTKKNPQNPSAGFNCTVALGEYHGECRF
jgi:hypothetical protein